MNLLGAWTLTMVQTQHLTFMSSLITTLQAQATPALHEVLGV